MRAMRLLAQRGVRELVADYLPTPKNDLVRSFLPEQGFAPTPDGRWHLDLAACPPRQASDLPDRGPGVFLRPLHGTELRMNLYDRVRATLAATLKVPESSITATLRDEDLAAWDSLGHVNLMMALEQTFDLYIEVEDFENLKSVPAIVDYLGRQGAR